MLGIKHPPLNELKIPGIIESDARKHELTIYGAEALRKQLPGFMRRPTTDYDIYSRKPKRSATRMKNRLNKEITGYNFFFTKKAIYPGTHRVMHPGWDGKRNTRDDYAVADYSKPPKKKFEIIRIKGIRYERVSSIAKGKRKILKDPESKYRHEKDRYDLQAIKNSNLMNTGFARLSRKTLKAIRRR